MKRVRRLRRTREWRPEISVEPEILERLAEWQGFHYDADAVRRRETEQALLMRWVRREMGRRLTSRERQIVELYYLEVMTLEEVARCKRYIFPPCPGRCVVLWANYALPRRRLQGNNRRARLC